MKAFLRQVMFHLNGWAMTHLCDDNHPPSEFLPTHWLHPAEVVIKAPPDIKLRDIQVTWIEEGNDPPDSRFAYQGDHP